MFEITPDHISLLDDTKLRVLVGLLCEAELRRHGHSTAAVTAGGNQTAPDGGLDVRVELPAGALKLGGYVLRPMTGFQVKAEDMPAKKVASEMAPKGTLRHVIKELIATKGAYVVVSSKGSMADKPLRDRKNAMRAAVAGEAGHEDLELDFFDRTRIASWVRDNPGLIAWVRNAIGQPMAGWLPYGVWGVPAGEDSTYVLDDHSRLRDTRSGSEGDLPIRVGVQRLRELLAKAGNVVRLVGLSGTGKTRLLAALFDDKVGDGVPLDPALAHYADMADVPDPAPRELALHLSANRHRAIVVMDNCPPAAHRSIAEACKGNAYVSVITVEYDVRDDAPEHTNTFLLEPASDKVIAKLVRQRYLNLAEPDVYRIAEVSGGNARLALAIAGSIKRGETLTGVPEGDLFERLFNQRGQPDVELLRAASICALVYSFAVEDVQGQPSELPVLAELAEMSSTRLYGYVEELAARQLVQRRAHWRAVLPQALAAWLAKKALATIPTTAIEASLLVEGHPRLGQSFSRRLGDLHDSPKAQEIVRGWLAPGGRLGNPAELDDVGQRMLKNVAPVDLDCTLSFLARAVEQTEAAPSSSWIVKRRLWLGELRSLAYESHRFGTAASLMMRLCVAQGRTAGDCSPLTELFQVCLSGTLAPLEARLQVLEGWLSRDGNVGTVQDEIALECVRALVKEDCRASSSFEFGARPRTYGYWPRSLEEVSKWFAATVTFVARLAVEPGRPQGKLKHLLAASFRDLWCSDADNRDALEQAITKIAGLGHWADGWIAVLNTLRRTRASKKDHRRDRLIALEKHLRPRDTLSKARAFLASKPWNALDVAGDMDAVGIDAMDGAQRRADATARKLGEELVQDATMFASILDELMAPESQRARAFGEGIASGASDVRDVWRTLVAAFAQRPAGARNEDVLSGFLFECGKRADGIQCALLDGAVEDPVLGPVFPLLQIFGANDDEGLARLLRSLQVKRAPARTYSYLFKVRGHSEPFRQLVLGISDLEGGLPVAIDTLHMRFHVLATDREHVDEPLKACARELLAKVSFEKIQTDSHDHLKGLVHHGFGSAEQAEAARAFAARLHGALRDYRVSAYHLGTVIQQLFRVQPIVSLDVFLGGPDVRLRGLQVESTRSSRLLDAVPAEVLLSWAAQDTSVRVPKLLGAVGLFEIDNETKALSWSPIMTSLVALATDKRGAYEAVEDQVLPHFATEEEVGRTRGLVQQLAQVDADVAVREWASEILRRMDVAVDADRVRERRRSTSFE